MNKAEFIEKWYREKTIKTVHRTREGGKYRILSIRKPPKEFESDLDALLKEEAVEFAKHYWIETIKNIFFIKDGNYLSNEQIYDNWKQLIDK